MTMFPTHRIPSRRHQARRLQLEQLEHRIVLSTVTHSDGPPADTYIVVFQDDVADPVGEINNLINQHRGQLRNTYQHALNGFSAKLPPPAYEALQNDPRVKYIEPNGMGQFLSQEIPPGIDRVDVDLNTVAMIDGNDERVDVNIAIIDSGIDVDHPDLNVVGGIATHPDYSPDDFDDDVGHGTHVAGIAAALDNSIGVVGVAPGANLWAVKVGNRKGIPLDAYLAGMDWVIGTRLDDDPNNDIDVANVSLKMRAPDEILDPFVDRMTDAGIVLVASAGNDSAPFVVKPAIHPRTLAVSATVDTDGEPGGFGPSTSYGADDTFADFTCYGDKIEIAAPGVDVYSTYKGGRYKSMSGTSMASPHVAGAAALFIAEFGPQYGSFDDLVDVELVRHALISSGHPQDEWGVTDTLDRGTHKEPLVNVATDTWVKAPVAHIASHVDNALLSGLIDIQIDARDVDTPTGDLMVSIDIDELQSIDALFNSDTGLYELQLDTNALSDGPHQIAAVAEDIDGHTSRVLNTVPVLSGTINVQVDNHDDFPTVTMVNPTDGSTVFGIIVLEANASDDFGVTNVDFKIGTATTIPATETSPDIWTANWDSTGLTDGNYEVSAVAADTLDQVTESVPSLVTVANSTAPGTMHVADLDGSSNVIGKRWIASIEVLVLDEVGTAVPLATVVVDQQLNNGPTPYIPPSTELTGVTDAAGIATISTEKKTIDFQSSIFTVTNILHDSLVYEPFWNTDPDGDSDGTTIEVFQDGSSSSVVMQSIAQSSVPVSSVNGPIESSPVTTAQCMNVQQDVTTQDACSVRQYYPSQNRLAAVDQIMANSSGAVIAELADTLPVWGEEPFDLLS
jgi:subtilisin family serine protease